MMQNYFFSPFMKISFEKYLKRKVRDLLTAHKSRVYLLRSGTPLCEVSLCRMNIG